MLCSMFSRRGPLGMRPAPGMHGAVLAPTRPDGASPAGNPRSLKKNSAVLPSMTARAPVSAAPRVSSPKKKIVALTPIQADAAQPTVSPITSPRSSRVLGHNSSRQQLAGATTASLGSLGSMKKLSSKKSMRGSFKKTSFKGAGKASFKGSFKHTGSRRSMASVHSTRSTHNHVALAADEAKSSAQELLGGVHDVVHVSDHSSSDSDSSDEAPGINGSLNSSKVMPVHLVGDAQQPNAAPGDASGSQSHPGDSPSSGSTAGTAPREVEDEPSGAASPAKPNGTANLAAVASAGHDLFAAALGGSLKDVHTGSQHAAQPVGGAAGGKVSSTDSGDGKTAETKAERKAGRAVARALAVLEKCKGLLGTVMETNLAAMHPDDKGTRMVTAAAAVISETDTMVKCVQAVPAVSGEVFDRILRTLDRVASNVASAVSKAEAAVAERDEETTSVERAGMTSAQVEQMCLVRHTSLQLAVAKKVLTRVRTVARVSSLLKKEPMGGLLQQASTLIIRADVQADLVQGSPDVALTIANKFAGSVADVQQHLEATEAQLCAMLATLRDDGVSVGLPSASPTSEWGASDDDGYAGVTPSHAHKSPRPPRRPNASKHDELRSPRRPDGGRFRERRSDDSEREHGHGYGRERRRRDKSGERTRRRGRRHRHRSRGRRRHYSGDSRSSYDSDDSRDSRSSVDRDSLRDLPRIRSLPGRPSGSSRNIGAMIAESSEEFTAFSSGRRRRRGQRSQAQQAAKSSRRELKGVFSMMRGLLRRGTSSREQGRDLEFQNHQHERHGRRRRHRHEGDRGERSPRSHRSRSPYAPLPDLSSPDVQRPSPRRHESGRHMNYDDRGRDRGASLGALPRISSKHSFRRGPPSLKSKKSSFSLFRGSKSRAPTPPSNFKRSRVR